MSSKIKSNQTLEEKNLMNFVPVERILLTSMLRSIRIEEFSENIFLYWISLWNDFLQSETIFFQNCLIAMQKFSLFSELQRNAWFASD